MATPSAATCSREVERHHDREPHDVEGDEHPRESRGDGDDAAVAAPPRRVLGEGLGLGDADDEAEERPPRQVRHEQEDEQARVLQHPRQEGVLRPTRPEREEGGDADCRQRHTR